MAVLEFNSDMIEVSEINSESTFIALGFNKNNFDNAKKYIKFNLSNLEPYGVTLEYILTFIEGKCGQRPKVNLPLDTWVGTISMKEFVYQFYVVKMSDTLIYVFCSSLTTLVNLFDASFGPTFSAFNKNLTLNVETSLFHKLSVKEYLSNNYSILEEIITHPEYFINELITTNNVITSYRFIDYDLITNANKIIKDFIKEIEKLYYHDFINRYIENCGPFTNPYDVQYELIVRINVGLIPTFKTFLTDQIIIKKLDYVVTPPVTPAT